MRADHNIEDESVERTLCSLKCKYNFIDFCDVSRLPGLGSVLSVYGMIWRFLVLGDPLVDVFVVRDLDSLILPREVHAVRDWLKSSKTFHIMRDSPMHNSCIMGGMWGANKKAYSPALHNKSSLRGFPEKRILKTEAPVNSKTFFSTLQSRLLSIEQWDYKGFDQTVLSRLLCPELQGDLVAHDAYHCEEFKESSPWPSQRVNGEFVGSPKLLYPNINISQSCPVTCRPSYHKDWSYC